MYQHNTRVDKATHLEAPYACQLLSHLESHQPAPHCTLQRQNRQLTPHCLQPLSPLRCLHQPNRLVPRALRT
jgi:hypothetical protein